MSGGKRALRPLVARNSSAQGGSGENSIGAEAASENTTEILARNIACQYCRRRRVRCDGVRPSCGECTSRDLKCDYTKPPTRREQQLALERQNGELQGELEKANQAFELLKTLPVDEAMNFLRHIRSTANPMAALNLMAHGLKRPRQLSEYETARRVVPAVQSGLEYELMVSHPKAYTTLLPIVLSAAGTNRLLGVPSHRQSDEIHSSYAPTTLSGLSNSPPSILDENDQTQAAAPTSSNLRRRSNRRRRLVNPVSAPRPNLPTTMIDERLRYVNIQRWTKVPINSDLAARLISTYLETDHPIFGGFDADLFITDLISLGNRFCSPFLVSALLYWSSEAYSSLEHDVVQFSAAFLEEAEALWQSHDGSDLRLTVIALSILGCGCLAQGQERLSSQYLSSATEMAERMELLHLELSEQMSSDEVRATSKMIWGYFNLKMVTSMSYRSGAPLKTPGFPMPRYDTSSNDSSFRAICEFWLIVHEHALLYYNGDERPIVERVEVRVAEVAYQKLLHWADSLPQRLENSESSRHHVLYLHIWYHSIVMDIFRPYLSSGSRLKSFSSLDSTPDAVFNASLNQLKRLVLNYRLYCPSATYSIWWQTGMLYVANGVIRDSNDPDWKFYLLLCIRGYQALSNTYRVAGGFVQSILSMALDNKRMQISEARQMLQEGSRQRHGHVDAIEGTWMIDLDLALSSQQEAQMERVVGRFEDSKLFEAFTSLDEQQDDGL